MSVSIALGPREIQVWSVGLTASEWALANYRAFLSVEEQHRIERFRSKILQRSYILSRGALRVLLGQYIGCRPGVVELIYGQRGKPALQGSSAIRFNASHSEEVALYAFALDCELGVDVEYLRELDDLEAIASRYFSPAEVEELLSLSAENRTAGFFRGWTRKAAYVHEI